MRVAPDGTLAQVRGRCQVCQYIENSEVARTGGGFRKSPGRATQPAVQVKQAKGKDG